MRRSHLFDFSAIGESFDFQQGLPKTWNPESGIRNPESGKIIIIIKKKKKIKISTKVKVTLETVFIALEKL